MGYETLNNKVLRVNVPKVFPNVIYFQLIQKHLACLIFNKSKYNFYAVYIYRFSGI